MYMYEPMQVPGSHVLGHNHLLPQTTLDDIITNILHVHHHTRTVADSSWALGGTQKGDGCGGECHVHDVGCSVELRG